MLIEEIISEKIIWAKKGNSVVRKHRCSFGPKKGRTVSEPSQCVPPRNPKNKINSKRVRAIKGKRMAKRSKKTKRINPISLRIKRMNRK